MPDHRRHRRSAEGTDDRNARESPLASLAGRHHRRAVQTPEQIAHYQAMPSWMVAVWAIGVWTAFIASVLLLFRRKVAFPIFVASLATFLIHLFYTYVLTDGGAIMGRQMAITSAVIVILLLFLQLVFARDDETRRAALAGRLRGHGSRGGGQTRRAR
jgi:hypothetical protein